MFTTTKLTSIICMFLACCMYYLTCNNNNNNNHHQVHSFQLSHSSSTSSMKVRNIHTIQPKKFQVTTKDTDMMDSTMLSKDTSKSIISNKKPLSIVMTAILTSYIPFIPIVQAVVDNDDNYEYGAVDAPIGIAIGGGLLAILTALLPIALKGGEEAFEEIKDRDSNTFGKRNDILSGNKKKK